MRVLITTTAGVGHVYPLVPLGRSLVARGIHVLWALPEPAVTHVTAAGLAAVSTGADLSPGPTGVMAAYPELGSLPPQDRPDEMFAKLWGAMVAPVMLALLSPIAAQFRPDVVVSDAAALAGHVVAAELGVPSVTSGFGPLLPEPRVARAGPEVASLWRSRGLEPRPYGGCYDFLYLDPFPPTLQPQDVPHVPHRQLIRPTGYTGPEPDGPLPLPHGRPDRPLVYLTMGTVFNGAELFADLVRALSELDVRLLVTVGGNGDPHSLGAQPDHVRVERYVSQSALLPHCSVVVSHAGSGTSSAALALGLPQLCLPQGADQFLNARAIAAGGAGLSLEPGQADVDTVRTCVRRLIHEPSFRAAAQQVATTIADMPSPDDVAAILEQRASGSTTGLPWN